MSADRTQDSSEMTSKEPIGASKRDENVEIARKAGAQGHGPGIGRMNEKAVSFLPSLKRLLNRFRAHKVAVGFVVVMSLLGVGFNVVGPKILGRATDYIVAGIVGKQLPAGITKEQAIEAARQAGNGDMADLLAKMPVIPGMGINIEKVAQILLIAITFYVIAALLTVAQGWILNRIVNLGIRQLRTDITGKLDSLPLSYFDKQPRGELLSRVTNDIDNIATSLQQTAQQMLNSVFMIVGVLVMMFWVSPLLAVLTLVIVPISGVVAGLIGKRSQREFAGMWKSTGELNAHIEEAYSGHALVKVFGRQREVEQTFAERNGRLRESSFLGQFLSGIMMPIMFFIGNLNYVVIAVVGGLRVASGAMPLGDVQAFIQYSRMFSQPISQLASMANMLQSGVASAERVFEVLDAEEISPEATGHLPVTRGRVEFDHVKFSYTPDRPLIEDLSLVAEPGQTIAIVGPTGAGKTTLVNLLMRFYELNGGTISLDGVDISTVPRPELRSKLGMVLQDTWLFEGTIRDNIAYGRPGATEDEIHAAAEAAYVDRFVHSLPDGYDTVIDDEGSNLSAGERQLVTIARAFLSDPSMLILDEATSSVDTRTELLVQQAMNALRSGRTSFVIAHRLSTIRDADLILVMENGAIVEQGSHQALLTSKGHYHALYEAQFAAAATDEDESDEAMAMGGAPV